MLYRKSKLKMDSEISARSTHDLGDLAYKVNQDELAIIVSARSPVRYPWCVHSMAAAVFLANLIKIPRAIDYVSKHIGNFISDESGISAGDVQVANAGVVVVCLVSGLVGTCIVYLMYRRNARPTQVSLDAAGTKCLGISMWLLIVATALILPDLWFAVIGAAPYSSWYFLVVFFLVIVGLTIWKGRARDLPATISIASLLGIAL